MMELPPEKVLMPCQPQPRMGGRGQRKSQHCPLPAPGTPGRAGTTPAAADHSPLPLLSPATAAGDVRCSVPFAGMRGAGSAAPPWQIPTLGLGLMGKILRFCFPLLQCGSKIILRDGIQPWLQAPVLSLWSFRGKGNT